MRRNVNGTPVARTASSVAQWWRASENEASGLAPT